jgi:hypothetical protein
MTGCSLVSAAAGVLAPDRGYGVPPALALMGVVRLAAQSDVLRAIVAVLAFCG